MLQPSDFANDINALSADELQNVVTQIARDNTMFGISIMALQRAVLAFTALDQNVEALALIRGSFRSATGEYCSLKEAKAVFHFLLMRGKNNYFGDMR